MTSTSTAVATLPQRALITKIAQRYEVDPGKLLDTLRSTVFKTEKPVSNEQMMTLLIVADQYKLNPFTRELFALVDKTGGVLPYVSVDGWARIVNEHPQFDGMEFEMSQDFSACTCAMFRKDRSHATRITEYMAECKRPGGGWTSTPKRMLRHRSMVQAARLAFGFAGIYDEAEARQIVSIQEGRDVPEPESQAARKVRQLLEPQPFEVADVLLAEGPVPASDIATLPDLMRELMSAPSTEDATLVLDLARTAGLSDNDQQALAQAYAARWGNTEEPEQ